jgi:hypothetical protein
MAGQRRFADAESLGPVVRAALGARRRVTEVHRLPGGSKKGAYRVVVDDGLAVLVYAWNSAEDYWSAVLPGGSDDPADPFSHASGLDLFEAAARRLEVAGVRCPDLLLTDRSGELYPGDVAVVEYVPGGSLEAALARDPVAAQRPLETVAEWLSSMRACQVSTFGKVSVVDAGQRSRGKSCPQVVLTRALRELDEICAREERAAREVGRLTELLHALAEPIEPRSSSGLVHGELGPDHILLDINGDPVLIDIEGLMYFDAEWEHVFLRIRFGDHYTKLSLPDLDPDRLRFYQLARHLNLVAGPLQIADGSHPERAWFLELANDHLGKVLAFGR